MITNRGFVCCWYCVVCQGEVNASKVPEGAGVFSYRGDDEHGRMCYDGDWANKAAHGYGVMKWQNGDRWPATRNHKFLLKHLFIIITNRYEGDWVDGRRQGKGLYVCKQSGSKYEVKDVTAVTSRLFMELLTSPGPVQQWQEGGSGQVQLEQWRLVRGRVEGGTQTWTWHLCMEG